MDWMSRIALICIRVQRVISSVVRAIAYREGINATVRWIVQE
ncbi:unnamed protein product, partial [Strongylus vulgaris]